MLQEAEQLVPGMMKRDHTFDTLNGNAAFRAEKTRMKYVLLPAWVLTWKGRGENATYYYMMNGQTGEVCGKLPVDKRKLILYCLGAGLIVFALLCAGGAWLW